ncbi:GNAT family N-acetyltransferase [Taklimakanibacter deserti]|uniref:GNAT family N-acetyltransferase n=1 Tax=Taklimakanibacter deserti TaxID=2267839 RepID=UPI0013C485B3
MSVSENPTLASLGAKLVDAKQALAAIKPGNRIYLGTGCAAPRGLIAALETMEGAPADLEYVSFLTTLASSDKPAEPISRYRHRSFFVGSDIRDLASTGRLEYVPIALEDVPVLLANGRLPIDVALLQVSVPDGRGFVSLGVSVDLAPAVLKVARHVIAEINPAMPRTHGASFVHIDRFDAFVNVETPITEYRHPPAGDTADRIARYIAAIIEDGSTLQIGLGRVPNDALQYIKDRRDLGIHSDVITDGVMSLVESGVVTGRRKTPHRDRIVASYCLGTRQLYDFVHDNPLFDFRPIEEVCDARAVAANYRMVSITQAFAMDLTGQVCIDQFEGQFYGGLSTQHAFMRGAAQSEGGKPIVCLASRTEAGASRIKPLLEAGDGVGIGRFNVHYVVTEYGIAYLFGKSIRERALAMIEIAHPDHRDALIEAARKLGYVPREQYLGSQGAYPVQEERRLTLLNGAEVLIRPAHAADADALRALFHRLSPDDVYTRFFRKVRSLAYQDLQTLCNVNHETQVAFLAVTGPREHEVVVASGCYFLNPTTNLAEVAYMVAPEWQGQGLGSALQARLQEYAMARGVKGFIAEILASNERMVRLAASATGVATTTREDDTLQVTTLFSDRPAAKPAGEAKPAKSGNGAKEKPAKTAPKRKSRRSSAK